MFRKRFIPREHIERDVHRYVKIRQDRHPVIEYIVEKEEMENSLGDNMPPSLKVTSFRGGLDYWLHEKVDVFRDMPFELYKEKTEFLDVRERKVRRYAPKREDDGKSASSSGNSGTRPIEKSNGSSPAKNTGNHPASDSNAQLRPKPSKDQLGMEGKMLHLK